VILVERSEIGGESRRQPAVTVRADRVAPEPVPFFVAVVDARFAAPVWAGIARRSSQPSANTIETRIWANWETGSVGVAQLCFGAMTGLAATVG
jgi:hypothetical protein